MNDSRQNMAECAGALEHLTGPSTGRVAWLAAPELAVFVGDDRLLRVSADPTPAPGETHTATLRQKGTSYHIDAMPDAVIWVNRRQATSQTLRHGDTLEFGELGPISRFRLLDPRKPIRWPIEEMLRDSLSYARFSRKPFWVRVARAAAGFLRRLATDTTVLFRATVVAVLAVLVGAAVLQYRTNQDLRQAVERDALRIEGVAAALARSRAVPFGFTTTTGTTRPRSIRRSGPSVSSSVPRRAAGV